MSDNGENGPGTGGGATSGRSFAIGCALAVSQAILYSTMGIFGKLLYATGLTPQDVIILRYLCATVILGAFLLIWRKQPLVSRQPQFTCRRCSSFCRRFSTSLRWAGSRRA